MFETVTKCGTGFTDKDLAQLPEMLRKHEIPRKHSRVLSTLEADVWFEPALVLEVLGAEITLSPIHTCAMDSIRKGSGLAIRFPRFTGKYRTDKAPEDATTSDGSCGDVSWSTEENRRKSNYLIEDPGFQVLLGAREIRSEKCAQKDKRSAYASRRKY